jgi:hypothetical protein
MDVDVDVDGVARVSPTECMVISCEKPRRLNTEWCMVYLVNVEIITSTQICDYFLPQTHM